MDRIRRAMGQGESGSTRLEDHTLTTPNSNSPAQTPNRNNVDQEQGGFWAEVNDATTLSWENRIYGFIFFFALGLVISFLGSSMLYIGKVNSFAALTSLGSIVSLCSTCFLMGPMKQLRKMFELQRLVATIVFILSIVMTLIAGMVLKKKLLALMFVVIQYLAMIWYSLSYIPFARDAVTKCLGTCIS